MTAMYIKKNDREFKQMFAIIFSYMICFYLKLLLNFLKNKTIIRKRNEGKTVLQLKKDKLYFSLNNVY